jgi:hypothetical protein
LDSLVVKPLERVSTAGAETARRIQVFFDVLCIDDGVADSLFGPIDVADEGEARGGVAHQARLLLVLVDVQLIGHGVAHLADLDGVECTTDARSTLISL